jgi:hypothetical protein
MGATYLSLQLRMTDRDKTLAWLESIAAANAAAFASGPFATTAFE